MFHVRTVLACTALLFPLAQPGSSDAQSPGKVERIVKKDGSVITGEITGFADGKYNVRTGDTLVTILATQVRTIEDATTARQVPVAVPQFGAPLDLVEVLEAIANRRNSPASPENVDTFHDAIAAVLRNEWDFGLRVLRRLAEREPAWADPQIVCSVVLLERGEMSPALRSALRLEHHFPHDALALRAAAEIYRRSGFQDRYCKMMEKVLGDATDGLRLDYELTRLWWPADPEKAARHWAAYSSADPDLRNAWCREGEVLRKAQLSLAIEDWYAAQMAVDELQKNHPWMRNAEIHPVRIGIAEARLRAAEVSGRVEEALLAAHTLQGLDPERETEWSSRLGTMQDSLSRQTLQIEEVEALRAWCMEYSHLVEGEGSVLRRQIAQRFHALALTAIAAGDFEAARTGIREAATRDPDARPEDGDALATQALGRVREELELGRRARAAQAAALLGDAMPERVTRLDAELSVLVNETAGRTRSGSDLSAALEEVRGVFAQHADKPSPVVRPDDAGGSVAAGAENIAGAAEAGARLPRAPRPRPSDHGVHSAGATTENHGMEAPAEHAQVDGTSPESATPAEPTPALTAAAQQSIRRYSPFGIGTRWVYRRGDGTREVRRVSAITPLDGSTTKVSIEVNSEGSAGEIYTTQIYLRGTDVTLMHPCSPPGEVALRYPFSDNASWGWKKDLFHYDRRVSRPAEPVVLPMGTFTDYFIVSAKNGIVPEDGGKPYECTVEYTYVAGIGLARIDSDNDCFDRVLVEFLPSGDATARR